MKLALEPEEGVELLSLIVDRLSEEAKLSTKDRAAVRRWRADEMRAASAGMRELVDKLNADLERALRAKERSAVQKADWR